MPMNGQTLHATVAARHMLWMEALAACICISVGVIAGFGNGPLWAALQHLDAWGGIAQSTWWAATLVSLGALLSFVDFFEIRYGRFWHDAGIMLSADLRWSSSAALAIVNAGLIGQLAVSGFELWGVMMVDLFLALFLARATFVTRRISIALDRKKHTPGLERIIREGL